MTNFTTLSRVQGHFTAFIQHLLALPKALWLLLVASVQRLLVLGKALWLSLLALIQIHPRLLTVCALLYISACIEDPTFLSSRAELAMQGVACVYVFFVINAGFAVREWIEGRGEFWGSMFWFLNEDDEEAKGGVKDGTAKSVACGTIDQSHVPATPAGNDAATRIQTRTPTHQHHSGIIGPSPLPHPHNSVLAITPDSKSDGTVDFPRVKSTPYSWQFKHFSGKDGFPLGVRKEEEDDLA